MISGGGGSGPPIPPPLDPHTNTSLCIFGQSLGLYFVVVNCACQFNCCHYCFLLCSLSQILDVAFLLPVCLLKRVCLNGDMFLSVFLIK